MSDRERPNVSVVVTTRNDNHGGDLLRRTQLFVNGLIGQMKRHNVMAELVIVEWNPPPDRPPIREALRWPSDTGPCRVRFIEVPAAIHSSYRNACELPLYQMIAKNVGIRRAAGQFILATNIDILFSDELMAFLAGPNLSHGSMYRIDRHDVKADVPSDAPIEEQLAYCAANLLRVNSRDGTFPVTSDGQPTLFPHDIADSGAGIQLGSGWFPPEDHGAELFRWVDHDASVTVRVPDDHTSALRFDVEPGPGVGGRSFDLVFTDREGAVVAEVQVVGRSWATFPLPKGVKSYSVFLSAAKGGHPVSRDPRLLNFRVFRCEWWKSPLRPAKAGTSDPPPEEASVEVVAAPVGSTVIGLARKIANVVRRAAEDGPVITVWVPIPGLVRRILRFCMRLPAPSLPAPHVPMPSDELSEPASTIEKIESELVCPPLHLHTNACGDFTLMAREHWFELRGYPEWDLYSFHVDSVLCHAAHHGGAREEVLREPMRIYHMEHGQGSGWTPEGQEQLFRRLREKGIPWLQYESLMEFAAEMRRLQCPMIFNRENWGLAQFDLPESALS